MLKAINRIVNEEFILATRLIELDHPSFSKANSDEIKRVIVDQILQSLGVPDLSKYYLVDEKDWKRQVVNCARALSEFWFLKLIDRELERQAINKTDMFDSVEEFEAWVQEVKQEVHSGIVNCVKSRWK